MNERTGLDCPSVSATASNVPEAPAGSVPAHPEGAVPGIDERDRGLDYLPQHDLEVEVAADRDDRLEQRMHPIACLDRGRKPDLQLRQQLLELPGGGVRGARVVKARALAMQPKVMLFDEVTSALDPELVGEVLLVMRRLAEEGMTMIIVTHEIPFARDVGDRIVFMDGGAIVEAGPPAQVLASPSSARFKLFLRRYQGDYLAV